MLCFFCNKGLSFYSESIVCATDLKICYHEPVNQFPIYHIMLDKKTTELILRYKNKKYNLFHTKSDNKLEIHEIKKDGQLIKICFLDFKFTSFNFSKPNQDHLKAYINNYELVLKHYIDSCIF